MGERSEKMLANISDNTFKLKVIHDACIHDACIHDACIHA